MSNDLDDPYVALEELDQKWASATEETKSAMQAWSANWSDQALKDNYYTKLDASIQACQNIMLHKSESGI